MAFFQFSFPYFRRGPFSLLLLVLFLLPGFTPPVQGQGIDFAKLRDDAVGVGLWYSTGEVALDAAPSSASAEVQGYTDVLPSKASGSGPGVGISFESWGINFGYDEGTSAINQNADLDGDGVTETYVKDVRRTNRSFSIIYQPIQWFYLGYGRDTGTMEFKQTVGGVQKNRKLAYEYDFYSLSLAIGADFTQSQTAYFLAAVAKIPVERSDFSGTTTGIGAGVFF